MFFFKEFTSLEFLDPHIPYSPFPLKECEIFHKFQSPQQWEFNDLILLRSNKTKDSSESNVENNWWTPLRVTCQSFHSDL